MHAALLVPDLVWPHAALARDCCAGLDAPALRRLAARGRMRRGTASRALDWIADRYGVPAGTATGDRAEHARTGGDRPYAPYTLLADGIDPGTRHWLRADPVHLQPGRDTLVLMPRGSLHLDHDEGEQLAAAVRHHLAGDPLTAGLELRAPRPDRWYLGMDDAPRIETTALCEAEGASISERLARGPDARRWHALFNELGMLLHAHPVNRRREARGEPPVNGLWFWGGGRYRPLSAAPFASVAAAGELARALALATAATAGDLPGNAAAWLAALRLAPAPPSAPALEVARTHLAVLDAPRLAARAADLPGWRQALVALEHDWFAPLAQALADGRIGSLAIAAPGAHALYLEADRGARWRLWRRLPRLEHLLAPDAGH
jgi:hypothetical protein